MEAFRTRLVFVAHRRYVLGADLYRSFEHFAAERIPALQRPRHVRVLKLVREVARDGSWRLDAPADDAAPSASVTVDYVDAAGARHVASLVEDGPPVADREEERATRVAQLERTADFSGRARLLPLRGTVELVYALVEVNKSLHVATLRERGSAASAFRFVYLEDLPVLTDAPQRAPELELEHLRAHEVEGRTYTLTKVRTNLAPKPLRLCYYFAD